ncbi:hypothetical protein GMORB2_2459 [Geosmithia morbida]|uniref:Uncharacterized protein n=1 Tax=Geosmithia morbida TaxID=1094350 RepID=A0A9P4YSM0_9HYPO|nr:uncharacterized protein GMORB2_2459 [Geosmithia morbida]KAF4120973.1 hypothetical protein GMORB2_2459 [Geosmithia morbida]
MRRRPVPKPRPVPKHQSSNLQFMSPSIKPQPIHIRMNLTESQMDKLTEAPRAMYEASEGAHTEPLRLSGHEDTHIEGSSPTKTVNLPCTHLGRNAADSHPFSPFPFYFRAEGMPDQKRRDKALIGEKGWLMRTDEEQQPPIRTEAKMTGILRVIRKLARDMTEIHRLTRLIQHSPEMELEYKPAISLDAREQSLLYGEMEFHMTDALNTYMTTQFERGRMSTDKLKKIDDAWRSQSHLPVVGFRYDLATQIDLVTLHKDHFDFPGFRDDQLNNITHLLRDMGTDARAMSVRTFCLPDSLVARHIIHAQSLFDLVGAAQTKHDALAEIASFFQVCIGRVKAQEATRLEEAEHQRRRREGRRLR